MAAHLSKVTQRMKKLIFQCSVHCFFMEFEEFVIFGIRAFCYYYMWFMVLEMPMNSDLELIYIFHF